MELIEQFRNWLHFNFLYFGNPPWDTNQSPPELLSFIASHKPGNVLDLGCGTGKNCLTLAQAGWKVTGVDFAPKAILATRQRFNTCDLQGNFILGDVTQIRGMDHYFDLVLDMGCYHVLPERSRQSYRNVVARVLKPEGVFLLFGHMNSRFDPDRKRLTNECVERFQEFLTLEHRQGGGDRRGRNGIWLWFKKPGL
jgi:SAM-dependent methyltransferase